MLVCIFISLTGAPKCWNIIGQISTVRDDLSTVQSTRDQHSEGVTCVLRTKSLGSQGGSRNIVQHHLT